MSKRHWRSIQNARTNKKAKIRTMNPRSGRIDSRVFLRREDFQSSRKNMSKRHWRSIQNARTNKKAKIRTTNPRSRTCHLQSARLLLHWRSRPIRVKGNQADSRKTERQKGGFLLGHHHLYPDKNQLRAFAKFHSVYPWLAFAASSWDS